MVQAAYAARKLPQNHWLNTRSVCGPDRRRCGFGEALPGWISSSPLVGDAGDRSGDRGRRWSRRFSGECSEQQGTGPPSRVTRASVQSRVTLEAFKADPERTGRELDALRTADSIPTLEQVGPCTTLASDHQPVSSLSIERCRGDHVEASALLGRFLPNLGRARFDHRPFSQVRIGPKHWGNGTSPARPKGLVPCGSIDVQPFPQLSRSMSFARKSV